LYEQELRHWDKLRIGLQSIDDVITYKGFGTVRFSLGPFNTEEYIERAIDAVRDLAETRRS
jgi:hypothetical protein